jgi:hypothetical protein
MSASVDLPLDSLDTAHFEVLDDAECFRLLAAESVGRVVYTDGALPAITPVNYVLDGRRVVFRTTAGSRLARGVVGAVVAFEVDAVDPRHCAGWSVVITGVGRLFTEVPVVHPWVGGDRDETISITPGRITGRRIS